MANSVVPVSDFGGLDLASSADQSACIDGLNFDLDLRGAVRSRNGYTHFTGSELTNQPDSLFSFSTSTGTTRLLVGNGNRVDALNSSGTSAANTTAPTASPHYFARFGGPTAEAVYFANGTDQVRKFVVDTFSSPAGLSGQTGRFVAVTPTSNRLAVARESGSTAGNNASSVNFSDAGAPETFTSTSYVDLDPGDGEAITGMVAWREYVFVFKPSKVFVFYSESTDATGLPIFIYKKVDTGIGAFASRAICAARDGVYFLARTGIYRMTGPGYPELVSAQVAPIFYGSLSSFYGGSQVAGGSLTGAAMTFWNERVYVSIPTAVSTNDRMLVFDPRYDYWLVWDMPAAALCGHTVSDNPALMMARPTGSNYVDRHGPSLTTDDGASITSRYRTGFSDLGYPGQEKDIDSTRMWGVGTVSVSGSRDFGDLDTATDVSLGSSPDIDRGLHNKQKKGELVSYQFASSSGSVWKLHRYAHYVRGIRQPGIAS